MTKPAEGILSHLLWKSKSTEWNMKCRMIINCSPRGCVFADWQVSSYKNPQKTFCGWMAFYLSISGSWSCIWVWCVTSHVLSSRSFCRQISIPGSFEQIFRGTTFLHVHVQARRQNSILLLRVSASFSVSELIWHQRVPNSGREG